MSEATELVSFPLNYKGDWDASGGSYPTGATESDVYRVSVAGTVSTIAYVPGDLIVATASGEFSSVFNTPGGGSGISNVVEDTTPQLGGQLDTQGNYISTAPGNGTVDSPPLILWAGDSSAVLNDGDAAVAYLIAGSGLGGNDGGEAIVNGGVVPSGAGNGGKLSLGGGGADENDGGDVSITGGDSSGNNTGSGLGGRTRIRAGDGAVQGGDVEIISGGSSFGAQGRVSLSPSAAGGSVGIHYNHSGMGEAELEIWKDTNPLHTTGFKVGLKVPAALAADATYILPLVDGAPGETLVTDGSKNLSFAAPAGGGDPAYTAESVPDILPSATGLDALAMGDGASATGSKSLSIGVNAATTAVGGIVIGEGSIGEDTRPIAFGYLAHAFGYQGIAVGANAVASGNSIAIGSDADASIANFSNIAIGNSSSAQDTTIALGNGASASGASGLSIGRNAVVTQPFSVAIGYQAETVTDKEFALGFGGVLGGSLVDRTIMRQDLVVGPNTTALSGIPVPNNTLWMFEIVVAATSENSATADESAVYNLKGVIKNRGGVTTMKGAVAKEILYEDVAVWDVNVVANDTTDELEIIWDFGGDVPVNSGAGVVGGLVTAKVRITEVREA